MKRLISYLMIAVLVVTLSGCGGSNREDMDELKHVATYDLISMDISTETRLEGNFSGAYLLLAGGMSGEITTRNATVYRFQYMREDGGIVPEIIDTSAYNFPKSVKVVYYINDDVTPKYEIWRNGWAKQWGDGDNGAAYTEFRFTVPTGSVVTTIDLGIKE